MHLQPILVGAVFVAVAVDALTVALTVVAAVDALTVALAVVAAVDALTVALAVVNADGDVQTRPTASEPPHMI